MAEAKRRNPDIVLLGLVYAWPSWVNPSGNNPWQSTSTEQNAANYIARWVSGCKSAHNLTIDWVGLWSKCDDAFPLICVCRLLAMTAALIVRRRVSLHQIVREDPAQNARCSWAQDNFHRRLGQRVGSKSFTSVCRNQSLTERLLHSPLPRTFWPMPGFGPP